MIYANFLFISVVELKFCVQTATYNFFHDYANYIIKNINYELQVIIDVTF